MSVAAAFLKRDLSLAISYRLSFLLQLLGILFSVSTFYFLSLLFGNALLPQLDKYGGDYFSFVLIGLAFLGYVNLSLSNFSASIREGQMMGTLEIMLLSPTRLSAILISSSLPNLRLSQTYCQIDKFHLGVTAACNRIAFTVPTNLCYNPSLVYDILNAYQACYYKQHRSITWIKRRRKTL